MNFITLHQVGVLAPAPLFQNLNLTIGETDRVGIIAGNGGGKSTLLRCIAGLAEPTTGTITHSRGLRLGVVEQDMSEELLDLPLAEAVQRALPQDEQAEGQWRVGVLLDGFETPSDLRQRPIRALSGGWQRLALIARAWAMEPDALLLDEPTNHLDLAKICLLERWINNQAQRMPMIIASHDRRFLDTCTTRTLFLRPEISKIYDHPYSRARYLLAEDDTAQGAKLDRDMKEADRLRRSASELRNIGINSHSDAAQRKSKQLAQRAAGLEQTFKPPHKERSGDIRLNSRETQAKVLLSFDDAVVRTPDGKTLFRTGKLKVFQGDRIIILGPNGIGKSQFVSLIRRTYCDPDTAPEIRFSPTVIMGYADQQMSQLPDHDTPFGFITAGFCLGDQRSRSLLAGAGFPVERQCHPIKQLSYGQKARLGMLALRLTQPNFYLLDEPTNHVDIAGLEKLEAEILAQEATCILASHDRSFVKTIGTRYFIINKGRLENVENESSD